MGIHFRDYIVSRRKIFEGGYCNRGAQKYSLDVESESLTNNKPSKVQLIWRCLKCQTISLYSVNVRRDDICDIPKWGNSGVEIFWRNPNLGLFFKMLTINTNQCPGHAQIKTSPLFKTIAFLLSTAPTFVTRECFSCDVLSVMGLS